MAEGLKYLEIPVTYPMDMLVGRCIFIKGSVLPDAKSFLINLQCGLTGGPAENIPFHLRFDVASNKLVRNTYVAAEGGWGLEELTESPLHPGQAFEVKLQCLPDAFYVDVNSIASYLYEHRRDPTEITHLFITGNIEIDILTIADD